MKRDGTLILCYHRVAEGVEDPFYLCVSPGNFAAHLEEISKAREPSTLADVFVPSRRPRVVVTLDDGYRDNLTNALPIAESKGVPITVFVTSGILGNHSGFWWDRLGTLLRSRPPHVREIDLPVGDRNVRLPIGSSGLRADLDAVRRYLLPLRVTEIERALDAVAAQWQVSSAPPPDAGTLTPEDLLRLEASDVVTIGAHTVDHVRLRDRPVQEQQDTITGSKQELEQAIGRAVSHFAYPFGHRDEFDDHSVDVVRSAAFDTACTTIPGTAWPSADPHRLPRRLVMDWGRLRFRVQMQRWKIGLVQVPAVTSASSMCGCGRVSRLPDATALGVSEADAGQPSARAPLPLLRVPLLIEARDAVAHILPVDPRPARNRMLAFARIVDVGGKFPARSCAP